MAAKQKFDVHQDITNAIVKALESAGEFQLPWVRSKGGSMKRPVNIASANPYNGVNIVSLWVASLANDYPSHLWGTYHQWLERGCQVRKGEKGSAIIFYKKLDYPAPDDEEAGGETTQRLMARASFVFNAAQVDGFPLEPEQPLPAEPAFDAIEGAERFAKATGAVIEERGDRACYLPQADIIQMPERRRFVGTQTSTPAEAFYSTLCHELVHWAGAKNRLDRDLSGRFGSEAYAVEELVAELGAAFLSGDLGITLEPRADHAQYIASWLKVLKNDKKAIFTAASKASEAANWLLAH